MNRTVSIIVAVCVLGLLLLFSTTFTVKYHELAIKSRFGQISEGSVIDQPGLYVRLPFFIDQVIKFDRRLQYVETPLNELSTSDGYQVLVRAFLLWQIRTENDGVLQFYKKYKSMDGAQRALSSQFNASLSVLSQFRFDELVGQQNKLNEAENALKQAMAGQEDQGVVPVTVGISQIVLPGNTATAVMTRMQMAKKEEAELERSRGTAEAEGIRNRASTEANKLLSFAQQQATDIKSQGNAQATKYMEEMSNDEELAIFLSWLDTLRTTLSRGVTIVLPTNLEPFHMLDPNVKFGDHAIPMPAEPLIPATMPEETGERH